MPRPPSNYSPFGVCETCSAQNSAVTQQCEKPHGSRAKLWLRRDRNPVLEFTEVFLRTLGDSSDVVTKEIYTFRDQGEVDLCLRPENTASVMRALVSNGLTQALPQRLFYAGPMFRRERPQKGRYRQFSQVGVELIGAPEPLADVEVIACGQDFLSRLGLDGQLRLEINTLGDSASRSAYRAALVEYFAAPRCAFA